MPCLPRFLPSAFYGSGGRDLMPALAGQAMNDWTPRGIQRATAGLEGLGAYAIGGPALAALDVASSSPRLMGETAYKYGQLANALTQVALKREFSYVFDEHKYPGVPDITLHEITDQAFIIGDIPVIPILVWHLKMPVLGFRFGAFTYITDANRIDDTEQQKIRGSEILVLNALRKEKHLSHFTLQEAIEMSQSLAVSQTYFTHISHQLGKHQQVAAELPKGIQLAFDNQVINCN